VLNAHVICLLHWYYLHQLISDFFCPKPSGFVESYVKLHYLQR